ncbi:Z-ring-associated protein ZapA [Candidatus Tenderia electrophaga]|jgi:cell division protein ZapA|uniref:Cell division protein ZapA n=1 Tax=Candidatus Tenderia electrophaga TaxID=1748243 RepID=A0A0S2T9Z1_9GAMM|nr:Z-ring-associated protein ZapA [Candidatus Tenderia electrophaga]
MANEPKPVVLTILGKEYRVACPPEEREALLQSAAYLDEKMCEIRDRGRTTGSDNIAVMAALNITHELMQKQGQGDKIDNTLSARVKNLQSKIEAALSSARQIEI